MSGATRRPRTTHQCGPSMRCNLCGQPYPWTDRECPQSASGKARAAAAKRGEAAARAEALARRFPVRVVC